MSLISPTEPRDISRRRRRFLSRALFVVACLITVIAAAYVEEKIRGRMAWRAYAAAAQQRGVKLDFADFIAPKIPDAENFASIPLFEAVFQAESDQPPKPYPYPLTLPPRPQNAALPNFSDPNLQRRIDLREWQKYFVEMKLLPTAGEDAAADTLQALSSFAPLLAQLREAGARPRCRFPVHWERTYEAGLPHLAILQSASKFYALRIAAHLELGHREEAYEEWHDGVRLLAVTAREPTIINALVRISCLPLLVNGVWSGLAAHQWSEPELRKIEDDLNSLDWLKDYVFATSCERGALNTLTDAMIGSPVEMAKIMKIIRLMPESSPGYDLPSWSWRFYPTGWLDQNKVMINRYFDEAIARIDPEGGRWFVERPIAISPGNFKSFPESLYYLVFSACSPAFQGFEKRFAWAATVTAQARLACALERYRLAHGNFPEALAELTPQYLPALPTDIVNGEPYRYRRTAEGQFVLYSVGPDLQDDGGVLDPKTKTLDRQLDWVWRYSVP